MEVEEIVRLIESVSTFDLSEFEYSEGDVKLILKGTSAMRTDQTAVQQAQAAGQPNGIAVPEEQQKMGDNQMIKSQLVGIFYRAPSEDAQSYAAVGDVVKKGQVLGLIETMKLMNEVESDRDGVLKEILVENEQVVEYGQPLFAIE